MRRLTIYANGVRRSIVRAALSFFSPMTYANVVFKTLNVSFRDALMLTGQ